MSVSKLRATLGVCLVLCLGVVAGSQGAQAGTGYKILYSFTSDQDRPYLSVVDTTRGPSQLAAYGSARQGGEYVSGFVFGVFKSGRNYVYRSLHQFCADGYPCPDGTGPVGRMVMDASGNLYGVTELGGTGDSGGVAFELMPNADRTEWTYVKLYDFGASSGGEQLAGGLTYKGVTTGALYDGVSPLYGMATAGGSAANGGVVFQLKPAGTGQPWKEKVLHVFCQKASCKDGANPVRVVADPSGNLFGIAGAGPTGWGIVFKLDATNKYRMSTLHTFCHETNCTDGLNSNDIGLAPDGTVYGITAQGGKGNSGLLYSVGAGGFTDLYDFCSVSQCADGSEPNTMEVTPAGQVYGTTASGKQDDFTHSTLFQWDGSALKTLYTFCSKANCKDGTIGFGLAYDGRALYGAADGGGTDFYGTAYQFALP